MSLSAAFLEKARDMGLTLDQVIELASTLGSRSSSAAIRQRRYRERGGGKIPEDMRQRVFERDGYACVYCDAEDHLCCDHDVPVSKGGETTDENLVTACRPCNSRKKDRDRKAYERAMSKDKTRTFHGHSEDPSFETKVSPTPPSKTQILPTPSPPKGGSVPKIFEIQFWPAYPRKAAKRTALAAFGRAVVRAGGAEPIMAGLNRVKPGWDDPKFIPHPATWLNRDGWLDEPPGGPDPPRPPTEATPEFLAQRLALAQRIEAAQ